MTEARRTKRIKRHLKALLKEERRLRAVSSPLLLFQNVSLTSDEAFILSRIDGHHPPRYIFSLSPLSDAQTTRTLVGLLRAGVIELEGEPEPAEAQQASEEPASSDETLRQEIEQLFELCQQQDHWQVLGLERDAGLEEIKRAFHEKVFRYHPDRHRQIGDPGFHKKLSYIFSRLDDAFTTLSRKVEVNSQPKLAEKAPPRPPAPRKAEAEEPPNSDGDHREARDLFRRAKQAFEKKDYWGTIVHCRHAIQFADDQAEYFHLLGLALARNRQWRQEAEENLKIATDLDSSKPEYFGALGALYRDEGLDMPARRMFEKAKGINPSYRIPDER